MKEKVRENLLLVIVIVLIGVYISFGGLLRKVFFYSERSVVAIIYLGVTIGLCLWEFVRGLTKGKCFFTDIKVGSFNFLGMMFINFIAIIYFFVTFLEILGVL